MARGMLKAKTQEEEAKEQEEEKLYVDITKNKSNIKEESQTGEGSNIQIITVEQLMINNINVLVKMIEDLRQDMKEAFKKCGVDLK